MNPTSPSSKPVLMPDMPTSRQRADMISECTDDQLAGLFVGKLVMLEDPNNHSIKIIDRQSMTPDQALLRLDLQRLGTVMLEEKPELVPMIADGMRCAVQAAPDLVQEIRNEVRRNYNKPPIKDAEFLTSSFEGKVTMQNESQTLLMDAKGVKAVLFANETFSTVPKVGDFVRVGRGRDPGKFSVEPIAVQKPTQGLSR